MRVPKQMNHKLRDRRQELGLTQKQVASRLYVTEQAYQRYEILATCPNVITAIQIARIFGTTVEEPWGHLAPRN